MRPVIIGGVGFKCKYLHLHSVGVVVLLLFVFFQVLCWNNWAESLSEWEKPTVLMRSPILL